MAELDVGEPDVDQRLKLARDARNRVEKLERILDRRVEHIGDAPAFVVHLQRLAVVALAVADIARHVHVGQKMHLDLDDAVTLARFAAPALDVE